MAEFEEFIAPTLEEAISAYIEAEFGRTEGDTRVEPDLETVRSWALAYINAECGRLRAEIGTDIPFQDALYQLKNRELTGWRDVVSDGAGGWLVVEHPGYLNDVAPDADKYPILYSEAAQRGMTEAALAAEWAANSYAWPRLLAALESRMATVEALKAAERLEDIEAALVGAVWPEVGVG